MIRPATVADVPAIARLVNTYAERGLMLHRSHGELYECLRDFVVYAQVAPPDTPPIQHSELSIPHSPVLGVCALEIVWADLAEVRSLAVDPACQGQGIGRQLVEAVIAEAQRLEIQKVFALTYEQTFFTKLGFAVVPMASLPFKVWSDCIKCPKRSNCDEIAMVRLLRDRPAVDETAPNQTAGRYDVPTRLVQMRPAP